MRSTFAIPSKILHNSSFAWSHLTEGHFTWSPCLSHRNICCKHHSSQSTSNDDNCTLHVPLCRTTCLVLPFIQPSGTPSEHLTKSNQSKMHPSNIHLALCRRFRPGQLSYGVVFSGGPWLLGPSVPVKLVFVETQEEQLSGIRRNVVACRVAVPVHRICMQSWFPEKLWLHIWIIRKIFWNCNCISKNSKKTKKMKTVTA